MDKRHRTGVTACVLSYNSWESLKRVIYLLDRQVVQPDRILVVDNGSSDGTVQHLRAFDSIEVVDLPHNVGVGDGHNTGIAIAFDDPECRMVWLLEHDTEVLPDCLSALLRAYEELQQKDSAPPIGALLPVVALDASRVEAYRPDIRDTFPSRVLTFNGPLIPRHTVELVGPIRGDFFIGQEDNEFHLRMKDAGLPVLIVPDAMVVHKWAKYRGIRPSVLRSYYSTRNSVFLEVRLLLRLTAIPEFLARAFGGAIRTIFTEDQKLARVLARLTATFDGLTGRMGRRDYWFLRPAGETHTVETTSPP